MASPPGLPRHVRDHELNDPRALLRLWRHAAARGLADYSAAGMVSYFALVAMCRRVAERSPVGLLRHRLEARDWHGIKPGDEEAAADIRRQLLGRLRAGERPPRADHRAVAEEVPTYAA